MNEANRLRIPSSFEFQMLAEASLDAANAAYADCKARDARFYKGCRKDKATFMAITIAFLFLRAIELALKAALMERGLASPREISSRELGHNIKNLLARATTPQPNHGSPFFLLELGVDDAGKSFIERYSDAYANKWFEYRFDRWDIPDLPESQQVAVRMVQAIKPIAQTFPPLDL